MSLIAVALFMFASGWIFGAAWALAKVRQATERREGR